LLVEERWILFLTGGWKFSEVSFINERYLPNDTLKGVFAHAWYCTITASGPYVWLLELLLLLKPFARSMFDRKWFLKVKKEPTSFLSKL
jgi:hypothetical protein